MGGFRWVVGELFANLAEYFIPIKKNVRVQMVENMEKNATLIQVVEFHGQL